MMATHEERWPPVYDAEELIREIKKLAAREDLEEAFYEWREDRSTQLITDVCQGDIVELAADVPVILADGSAAALAHREGAWLIIGNTCDFARDIRDVRWTQSVPLVDLGGGELPQQEKAALRRYTQSRVFYVPPWSDQISGRFYAADFLRPVALDKRAFGDKGPAKVKARMSRAAWILLNACLVRFLARDDGRYAA